MIFTIVLPVLVTLFMAFTNYDFNHIPPAALIDWIGIQNFDITNYSLYFCLIACWICFVALSAACFGVSLPLAALMTIFSAPTLANGEKYQAFGGGKAWVISQYSKNKGMAQKFIDYLTTDKNM